LVVYEKVISCDGVLEFLMTAENKSENERNAVEIRLRIEALLQSPDYSDVEKLAILSKVLLVVESNS
jgi:hypothetical protein